MRAAWLVPAVVIAACSAGGTGGYAAFPDLGSEGGLDREPASDTPPDETLVRDEPASESDDRDVQADPGRDASRDGVDSASLDPTAQDGAAGEHESPAEVDEPAAEPEGDLPSDVPPAPEVTPDPPNDDEGMPDASTDSGHDAAVDQTEPPHDLADAPECADPIPDSLVAGDVPASDNAAADGAPDLPACVPLTTEVLCYLAATPGGMGYDPTTLFADLGGHFAEPFLIQDQATLEQAWTNVPCPDSLPSVAFGTESVVAFVGVTQCFGCLYVKDLDLCDGTASFLFSSVSFTGCTDPTVAVLLVRVPAAGYGIEFSKIKEFPSKPCPCPPPPDLDQC